MTWRNDLRWRTEMKGIWGCGRNLIDPKFELNYGRLWIQYRLSDYTNQTSAWANARLLVHKERSHNMDLFIYGLLDNKMLIATFEPSKARVLRCSFAGIASLNNARSMEVLLLWVLYFLSGRSPCDGPIPRPEDSYRLWCVTVCDQVQL
jgi:hypothetical protein